MPSHPHENVLQDDIPAGELPVLAADAAAAELTRLGQDSGRPGNKPGTHPDSYWKHRVTELEAELAQRTVQLEKLQRALTRTAQTHSGTASHRRERDGTIQMLAAEWGRSQRSREELDTSRARLADDITGGQRAELERRLANREKRMAALQGKNRTLTARVKLLATEQDALYEALATRSQVIGHLESQFEQLRADRSEHATALARACTELARLTDLLDERETQLRASEAGLAHARSEIEKAQEATAAAELQHAEDLEHIAGLEDQLETSAELAEDLTRLQRERDVLEASAESAEENQRELEVELREQQRLIEQLRQAQAHLGRDMATSQTLRQEQDVLIAELRRQMRDKNQQLKRLRPRHQRHVSARDGRYPEAPGSGRALSHRAPDHPGRTRLLLCVSGDQEVRYPLSKNILTIGRTGDNDIQLNTHCVSRRHARLVSTDGKTVIEDLNSKNGVYVNALRVARQRLRPGDHVTIGETAFRYVIVPTAEH
jgi:hypothetical protein